MSKPEPFVFDATGEAKRFAPATERNRDAIVQVLGEILPATGLVLEVASGTGEHVVYFAQAFRQLVWQPSDPDPSGLGSIAAWSAEAGLPNLLPPVMLDAGAPGWPVEQADAILCINMVHISPWAATEGLFSNAARLLPQGGVLYLYGPYTREGVPTAESNLSFDASLRERNSAWGLRALEDVEALAATHGFSLGRVIEMPSNNLSLAFYIG